MQQLEKPLENAFKSVPPLPENARKGLATALPWLALLGGVLSLVGAWNLYRLTTIADQYLSGIYNAFGYTAPLAGVTATAWVAIIVLVVQAVMLLVAFPALRANKKSGWNLVFWADLLMVVYTVVTDLFSGYVNIGSFIVYLLGTAVGLYLLFQVRPYFTGAGAALPNTPKTTAAPAEKIEKPAGKTEPKA